MNVFIQIPDYPRCYLSYFFNSRSELFSLLNFFPANLFCSSISSNLEQFGVYMPKCIVFWFTFYCTLSRKYLNLINLQLYVLTWVNKTHANFIAQRFYLKKYTYCEMDTRKYTLFTYLLWKDIIFRLSSCLNVVSVF